MSVQCLNDNFVFKKSIFTPFISDIYRRSDLDTTREKLRHGDRHKRKSETSGYRDHNRRGTNEPRYDRDYRKGYSMNQSLRGYRYVFLMCLHCILIIRVHYQPFLCTYLEEEYKNHLGITYHPGTWNG